MSDQAPNGDQEQDPFDTWLETVGFAKGFPRLRAFEPSADSSKFFLTELHQNQVDEISESLGNAAIAIVTAPGHGATTLARYLFERAREESIIRRAIPVWVSIEDLVDATSYDAMVEEEYKTIAAVHEDCRDRGAATRAGGGEPNEDKRNELRYEADNRARAVFAKVTVGAIQEAIQSAVRLGIVRSLVTRPWERVLQKVHYRDLIGATVATPSVFAARRLELTAVLENSGLGGVAQLAPQLADERSEGSLPTSTRRGTSGSRCSSTYPQRPSVASTSTTRSASTLRAHTSLSCSTSRRR